MGSMESGGLGQGVGGNQKHPFGCHPVVGEVLCNASWAVNFSCESPCMFNSGCKSAADLMHNWDQMAQARDKAPSHLEVTEANAS
jgi:hypothetical protein